MTIEAPGRNRWAPSIELAIINQVRAVLSQRRGPVMIRIAPVQVPVESAQKIEA